MKQAAAIDALKRAAQYLRSSPDAGVRMVGAEFDKWIEGDGPEHLEQSFGLGLPGPRSISTARNNAERIELINQAAHEFFQHHSEAAQAEAIRFELDKYRSTAWIRDRETDKCPARAGTLRGILWQILKLRDWSLSARQIRRFLATSSREMASETVY